MAGRFGTTDRRSEIHIGIVRQFSAEHPTHYGMIITSKIPRDQEIHELPCSRRVPLTMEPSGDVNLTGFLDLYKKAGACTS